MAATEVLVTRRLPASTIERLSAACEVDLHAGPDDLAPDQLRARVSGKTGLLCVSTDRIDAAVFEAGPDLRVVATVAVGYDHIDVTAARAHGVVVTNTPDVLTSAVAETTVGLMLAITHRIAEGDRLIRSGGWGKWSLDFMLGTELRGKRLGIVGAGRIGTAVAAVAAAFGMDVVFCESFGGGRPSSADGDGTPVPRVSFDELLVTSDLVTLHVPLTERTRHLIDRRALARMKRSAYLINVARGPVVDESALVWALGQRLIAGAALDVYEDEPHVHPGLLDLQNVVLLPHLGSATRETRTAMIELAADNIVEVLAGRPPLTPVD